jgi:hypothetical protein
MVLNDGKTTTWFSQEWIAFRNQKLLASKDLVWDNWIFNSLTVQI